MVAHSKLATVFGTFGSYPEEVLLLILEKCTYADMASLAATNASMKTFIGSEMRKKAFVGKWTREQKDETAHEDCHTGVGQLIETVFGATDEGLSMMKRLLEAGFQSSKSFGGAGLMIGAYLNSQPRVDEQLVTKAFHIGWNLGDGFLDDALKPWSAHLEAIDVFDRFPFDRVDEMDGMVEEKIQYRKSDVALYHINRHITRLLFFPTNAFIRSRLVIELFAKARLVASNDDEQLARFLHIILSPVEPKLEYVDILFYEVLDAGSEEGRAALTNLANFWKILLDDVTHSAAEMSLLSLAFQRSPFDSSAPNLPAFLSLEPSLLGFYLHDVSVRPPISAYVLSQAFVLMHQEWHDKDDVKLDELRAVIEVARDKSAEHNRLVLDELCDKVLHYAQLESRRRQALGEEYTPDKDRFLTAFLRLRR